MVTPVEKLSRDRTQKTQRGRRIQIREINAGQHRRSGRVATERHWVWEWNPLKGQNISETLLWLESCYIPDTSLLRQKVWRHRHCGGQAGQLQHWGSTADFLQPAEPEARLWETKRAFHADRSHSLSLNTDTPMSCDYLWSAVVIGSLNPALHPELSKVFRFNTQVEV